MNNLQRRIVISVLMLIIIISGGYILKTIISPQQEANAEFTAATDVPKSTARAETPASDANAQSAQARQALESDPAKPKEVARQANTESGTQSPTQSASRIIVLDPGHGKSSDRMSDEEKLAEGYSQRNGSWGEWRHWKTGSSSAQCEASGCSGRAPSGGSCWYPIGSGDRSTEPEINLNNALSAKSYLEQMGYTVRMTRISNDQNPSFSKRISYCYPNNDNTQTADAEVYVCIHSNAGGGRGSAYISAGGTYDQKMKNDANSSYAENSNTLGGMINERIVAQTSLSKHGSGSIGSEEALIAFCKSPVPVGYVEIGFFDNSNDLAILRSESDKIGLSIAEGIDDYIKSH